MPQKFANGFKPNTGATASSPLAAKLYEASALWQQGDLRGAETIYEKIARHHPKNLDALMRLGILAGQSNNHEKAIVLFDKILAMDPLNAASFNNRGMAQQGLEQWELALVSHGKAIAIRPDYAVAHYNRAIVLGKLNRMDEALASYEQAIAIAPDFAEAHYNRGVILADMKRWDEALASFDRAIAVRGHYAEAHFNRANALRELTQLTAALAGFDRAIAIKDRYAEAYLNRGDVLHSLKQLGPALESYSLAMESKPNYAAAHFNRGNIFRELKQFDAAIASYDQAFAINPNVEFLFGSRRYARMQTADWDGIDADTSRLEDLIGRDEAASPPFNVVAMLDSGDLQLSAARIWVRNRYPPNPMLPAIARHPGHDRVRIGYFSADFHNHATTYLIAGLLELHDRSKFDIIAFSFGPDSQDGMRKRVIDACDEFIDVRQSTDADVAMMARKLNIDIAVDLKGFTQDSRPGIFALRAAPLQINYLGYPGTMGAPYMDYVIADHTLVPDGSRRHFAEKVIRMPDSYQVNDAKRRIAGTVYTREELGLPADGFVFCCFNNNYKILPGTFDCWMRILRQVPGSVVWLFEDNPSAVTNLRREAARRDVDGERLIFAKRMDLPDHLARHRAADLFLDTWPCNAHTTASDALWAGLPVLTRAGESFASRVAASLLTAIGVPELIAATPAEYEALAIRLGSDPRHLEGIRRRVDHNRLTTALFDTERYVRHLESAYAAIYERYRASLRPAHVDVAAF